MSQIMLEEVDSQLTQFIAQVRGGEEVIIMHNSTLVAKVVPINRELPVPLTGGFGSGKYALIYMADDLMTDDLDAKAILLPIEEAKKRPGYGEGKDDILYMADDFDAPLEDFKDYM